MLWQITVKLPLFELFRIDEHKSKALSWLGGIGNNGNMNEPSAILQTSVVVEYSGIISQIPQMVLDDSSVAYIEDIDPFFISLIIKGKTLSLTPSCILKLWKL